MVKLNFTNTFHVVWLLTFGI